jgi:hypothetical protein
MVDLFIWIADLLTSYGVTALTAVVGAAALTALYAWKPEIFAKASKLVMASGPALLALFRRLNTKKNNGA